MRAPRSLVSRDRTRRFESGGAEGDRTPDLIHAMDALSQLSYGPETLGLYCGLPGL
jgi:hypothetical protein